jgi:hypothetical protein
MDIIGKEITLQGISSKGKNRIQEYGTLWKINGIVDKVVFSTKSGPWLNLTCIDKKPYHMWIHQNNDVNFKIEG